MCQANSNVSDRILNMKTNCIDDEHRISSVLQSMEDKIKDIQVYQYASNSHLHQRSGKSNVSSFVTKPKRVASFTAGDIQLPVDYRQFLRHTDRGAYLYAQEQRQQQQQQQRQTTLEHSLGYFP